MSQEIKKPTLLAEEHIEQIRNRYDDFSLASTMPKETATIIMGGDIAALLKERKEILEYLEQLEYENQQLKNKVEVKRD